VRGLLEGSERQRLAGEDGAEIEGPEWKGKYWYLAQRKCWKRGFRAVLLPCPCPRERVKPNPNERKMFYIDESMVKGTSASVRAMATVIANGTVNKSRSVMLPPPGWSLGEQTRKHEGRSSKSRTDSKLAVSTIQKIVEMAGKGQNSKTSIHDRKVRDTMLALKCPSRKN
jgi:hypothetical protein